MGLIITPGGSPMSFVWSSLNMGNRLKHLKENHPSKTYDGASYASQEFGVGAERFGYIFGNTVVAPKVN